MAPSMRLGAVAVAGVLLVVACTPSPATGRPATTSIAGSGSVAALRMIDATDGWAFGGRRLLRTTDGGRTFVDVTPPTVGLDRLIRSEDFLDARRAWVLVGPVAGSARETLEATSDGGATWTQLTSPSVQGIVEFVDTLHGWIIDGHWIPDCSSPGAACGPPQARQVTLERTTDGGVTWATAYQGVQHVLSDPMASIPLPGGSQMSLQTPLDCGWIGEPRFVTAQLGFVGLSCPGSDPPVMGTTVDGGHTWRQVSLPAPPGLPNDVVFTSAAQVRFFTAAIGVALVSRCIGDPAACVPTGVMVRTADGGRTWAAGTEVHSLGLEMEAADADHAWLLDAWLTDPSVQSLLATGDAGTTWSSHPLPGFLTLSGAGSRSFQLVTPQLGFVSISTAADPSPRFYRTDDGGVTFTLLAPRYPGA